MKTIFDKEISLPKRINCRIDLVHIGGKPYAALVDYSNHSEGDKILYLDRYNGQQTIGNLYSEFKWMAANEMPIDTFSFAALPYPFRKIENVLYQ